MLTDPVDKSEGERTFLIHGIHMMSDICFVRAVFRCTKHGLYICITPNPKNDYSLTGTRLLLSKSYKEGIRYAH